MNKKYHSKGIRILDKTEGNIRVVTTDLNPTLSSYRAQFWDFIELAS
jgi:hypothetical protein